jgi:hypothetical protein
MAIQAHTAEGCISQSRASRKGENEGSWYPSQRMIRYRGWVLSEADESARQNGITTSRREEAAKLSKASAIDWAAR